MTNQTHSSTSLTGSPAGRSISPWRALVVAATLAGVTAIYGYAQQPAAPSATQQATATKAKKAETPAKAPENTDGKIKHWLFVLPIDPVGVSAQRYLATLAAAAPGEPATYDGLRGWLAEQPAPTAVAPWRTSVAGDAAFLPRSVSAGHGHGAGVPAWLSHGGLTPASAPLSTVAQEDP